MPQLLFVIDPMCSWSWGFWPVMEELRRTLGDRYRFALVAGGLRTSGDMKWDKQSKTYLRQNWEAVIQKTGQPFSYDLLERSAFDYDTYPACKALVSVRELWGEAAAFDYLGRIQRAFYLDGEDTTSAEVLARYVDGDPERFIEFFSGERAETLMRNDFAKARVMGANAFPSTVMIDEAGHLITVKGYKTAGELTRMMR